MQCAGDADQDSVQELNIQLAIQSTSEKNIHNTMVTLMSQWFCAANAMTQLVEAWSSNNKLYFLFTILCTLQPRHLAVWSTITTLLRMFDVCFQLVCFAFFALHFGKRSKNSAPHFSHFFTNFRLVLPFGVLPSSVMHFASFPLVGL